MISNLLARNLITLVLGSFLILSNALAQQDSEIQDLGTIHIEAQTYPKVKIVDNAPIIPDQIISPVVALDLSQHVYSDGNASLPDGWVLVSSNDDYAGLKYNVYENRKDNVRVISFAGSRTWADWFGTNFRSSHSLFEQSPFLKGVPHVKFENAKQVVLNHIHDLSHNSPYEKNYERKKDMQLVLTAHSQMAGFASVIGAMTRTPTFGFNGMPTGGKIRSHLSNEDKKWAEMGVMTFNAKSDPVHKVDMIPTSKHIGMQIDIDIASMVNSGYKGKFLNTALSNPITNLIDAVKSHTLPPLRNGLIKAGYNSESFNNTDSSTKNYLINESFNKPTASHISDLNISGSLAGNSKKTVIFGYGPVAQKTYDKMRSNLGQENVQWVHSFPSSYERNQIAQNFGADTIMKVNHQQYREITKSGYTERIPINFKQSNPPPFPKRQDVYDDIKIPQYSGGGGGPPGSPAARTTRSLSSPVLGSPGGSNSWNNPSYGVGGVMLKGKAAIEGEDSDLNYGNFSLIFENSNGEIDVRKLRMFVTALWAVYFSKEGPGISIDPIAPGVDKHIVRYIGQVINSDLGRVMRETDYIMKKWSVGTDRADIPGFKNPDDIAAERGVVNLSSSRFWFVPQDMKFRKSGDMLLYEDGVMTLQTEYLFGRKRGIGSPENEEFARFFTNHYWEIAQKYPIYEELFEYAKLVSLARYLKEKRVPMLWFLLANKDMVITEDSPGTVVELVKESRNFDGITISGGVDLAMKTSSNHYVIDKEAAKAIKKAYELHGDDRSDTPNSFVPTRTVTFQSKEVDYTLSPSQDITLSDSPIAGETFQTDIALQEDGEPQLELVRYYNPNLKNLSAFGNGWHLMIPYRVEPTNEEKIEFLNAMIPEEMVVENLLTGQKVSLNFSDERYSIAGYVPEESGISPIIGLFLMSNGSFRLVDKIGSQFHFNPSGRLTDMMLTDDYYVQYEYGIKEINWQAFDEAPYRIETYGNEMTKVANAYFPKRLLLIDTLNDQEELFNLDKDNEYGIAGYSSTRSETSKYAFMAIMSDATYLLEDKEENQIEFDEAGRFNIFRGDVLKAITQDDHKITFDYGLGNGRLRIQEAHIIQQDRNPDELKELYTVKYEYGRDGRLANVTTPFGEKMEIKYDDELGLVASK